MQKLARGMIKSREWDNVASGGDVPRSRVVCSWLHMYYTAEYL
jgi:hypothetical protein